MNGLDTLSARSLRSVWHPCTPLRHGQQTPPLAIARGEGPWLIDTDGRRYFDAISSWWVNLFGHADPTINQAIKQQLDTLPHVMLAGCTHESAVVLAEKLSALTGGELGHAFYGSDGASAVEIALKMSFHAWCNQGKSAKNEFVCLQKSYHGETLGALSVTDVSVFRDAYDPLLLKAHVVASPDARQAHPGESAADVAQRALVAMRELLQQREGRVAAVIVEPLIQCAGGMAMYDGSYLRGLRALCNEFEVHLIADEIAVGCGRSGSFFAFEQAALAGQTSVWPDFILLSKGITGGTMALSVVLTRDAIYQQFVDEATPRNTARSFLHSHSYSGNPLACRAAWAVLERFEREAVLEQNRDRSALINATWNALGDDDRLRHVRQQGMVWAFDVDPHVAGAQFAERFHLAARHHELLIRPIGHTVYLMPPYLLPPEQYEWLARQTLKTLNEVTRGAA